MKKTKKKTQPVSLPDTSSAFNKTGHKQSSTYRHLLTEVKEWTSAKRSTRPWRCSLLSSAASATRLSFWLFGPLRPSSSPPCAWSSPWLWPTFWLAAWPSRRPWQWTVEPRLLSTAVCFSAAWSSRWPSSQFCVWWLSHWIASFVCVLLLGKCFFFPPLNIHSFMQVCRKWTKNAELHGLARLM